MLIATPGARDDRDPDRRYDVADLSLARAERRDHRDRDDDEREAEQDVHEPLYELVHAPAQVRANDAQHQTQSAADERGGEADEQRGARAIDDAREDIAAERIGPKKVL